MPDRALVRNGVHPSVLGWAVHGTVLNVSDECSETDTRQGVTEDSKVRPRRAVVAREEAESGTPVVIRDAEHTALLRDDEALAERLVRVPIL